jgi:hypothetical protein
MTMMSLTPTTVIMNFTQPNDSLPLDEYRVSLTSTTTEHLLTESELTIGDESSWLVHYSNLSEFTVYTVTIVTMNFAYKVSELTSFDFTTLSSSKSKH